MPRTKKTTMAPVVKQALKETGNAMPIADPAAWPTPPKPESRVDRKRLNALAGVAKQFQSWKPAGEVLTKVLAHPTIFPSIDRATGVGGWPIQRVTLVHGPSNHGKALPVDEQVLTPQGWVPIGELKVGDQVIGSNGEPTRVDGVFPQGVKECVALRFDDGALVRCCIEHLWSTSTTAELNRGRYVRGPRPERERISTGEDGQASVKTTRELMNDIANGVVHYMPRLSGAVRFDSEWEEQLPIDPYALGLLLGDGSLHLGSPVFTSADPELFEALSSRIGEDTLTKLHIAEPRTAAVLIRGQRTMSRLRGLGVAVKSYYKFVPSEYLAGSIETRQAILAGLLDTDGSVTNEGTAAEFSTTSERLAADVASLVRSLGGRAKVILHHEASEGMAKAWRVLLSHVPNPFRLQRKREKWQEREKEYRQKLVSFEDIGELECVCIKVAAKDELFVTSDFVLTHNTQLVHGLGLSFLRQGNFYAYVDAEYTTPVTWLAQLMEGEETNPAFIAQRPKSMEETIEGIREFAVGISKAREAGDIPEEVTGLIVVDSIRKLVPQKLLDKILKGDGGMDGASGRGAMMKAALNAQWMDELVPLLYHSNLGMVIISRETEAQQEAGSIKLNEPGAGFDYKVGGGKGLIYESSLVCRVTRSWLKEGTGDIARVLGERHKVSITKTKLSGKTDKVINGYFNTSNGLLTPEGFDLARDVFDMAVEQKVIEQTGAWFRWTDQKWQGESKAILALSKDEALLHTLEGLVR